jgi:hypothetical protein
LAPSSPGSARSYQALDGNQHVDSQEWVAVAIATVAALGVVWGVPNKDSRGVRQDQSVQPPDDLSGMRH